MGRVEALCLLELLCTGEKCIHRKLQISCVKDSIDSDNVECYYQQNVFVFSLVTMVCIERKLSVRRKKTPCENTPKNPKVIILANVILGP